MGKITLSDRFQAAGNTLEEFEEMVHEMTACTHFIKAKGDRLKFLYKMETPVTVGCYKLVQLSPDDLFEYEQRLAEYDERSGDNPPVFRSCTISTRKLEQDGIRALMEESLNACGFAMLLDGKLLYVADGATTTLCMRAGIAGERTARKSLYLTQAICEALGDNREEMTMVVRALRNDRGYMEWKVFAFLSKRYADIPMEVLPKAVRAILKDGKLGEAEVKRWYMDHNFTAIRMEFPDAGEEFSDLEGLSETVVPGLVMMTSDTGSSSLIVRGTYRVKGRGGYVIVDEYAHKHSGSVTAEDVLKACDEKIMQNFRKLPEALAEKMGNVIGSGSVASEKEKKANMAAVQEALKNGMKTLGLKKDLGLQRSKDLLEQMGAEIDPSAVYSEYDIAMTFLGLPDRIDGLSKEMQTRIAKDCGKAPFISYKKKKKEEEIVLLPGE